MSSSKGSMSSHASYEHLLPEDSRVARNWNSYDQWHATGRVTAPVVATILVGKANACS
jgi:hypothetical protein